MYHVRGVAFEDKIPLIVKKIDGKYICYDGTQKGEMSIETRQNIFKLKTRYLYIPMNANDKRTVEEFRSEYIDNAKYFKSVSNGAINFFRGYKHYLVTTQAIHHYIDRKGFNIEPIQPHEIEYLEGASYGANVYGVPKDKPYLGPIYEYDKNSSYSDVMSRTSFKVPIKAGVLKKYPDDFPKQEWEHYYPTGIYKAKISYTKIGGQQFKLFRLNNKGYYTNYDMSEASKLGLKIELSDEPKNMLYYERHSYKLGSEIFGDYIKLLYKLKIMDNKYSPIAKSLLKFLWSSPATARTYCIPYANREYECEGTDKYGKLIYRDRSDYYLSPLARYKCFVSSCGRHEIAKYIKGRESEIIRCHTDSLITLKPLNDLTVSNKLGEFKMIYHEAVYIEGCKMYTMRKNHIKDFFKKASEHLDKEQEEINRARDLYQC